jgi:transcriptional regulator GlxA family with amidase domain
MFDENSALASLQRLRSAMAELSSAIDKMLENAPNTSIPTAEIRVRSGLAPWQVRRVLAYVEENLGAPIRNKDLALIARLSVYYFNVAFRNSVGSTPHEYVIRQRVKRAQRLMLSTENSLSDIAAECGMADQAHLTRLFRKIVGDSPAAWRRARLNPAA